MRLKSVVILIFLLSETRVFAQAGDQLDLDLDESTLIAQTSKPRTGARGRSGNLKRPSAQKAPSQNSPSRRAPVRSASPRTAPDRDLSEALALAKKGMYQEASIKLFQLIQSPRYADQKMQIRYIMGLMLFQLKLNQVAAFQFVSVVKNGDGRYLKQSLEKLSLAADFLGDDTMLNYAISRVDVNDFPRVHRDMLFFRIGEYQLRNQQQAQALESFNRVRPESTYYPRALYNKGLAYSELNETRRAVQAFDQLMEVRKENGITDEARVAGLVGKARALYQAKSWDEALESYRDVPRDTEFWHDTLFESSWAMLRSGRFRSALSNFHSLHSSYYEEFYQPESLLLRAIVYLYICKYEEMDKVLGLFNRLYEPLNNQIGDFLDIVTEPTVYFNETVKVLRDVGTLDEEQVTKTKYKIPYIVARRIIKEGDFQSSYAYIKKLIAEKKRLQELPGAWRNSSVGRYSAQILENRIRRARESAGRQVRNHMIRMKAELVELITQRGFIEFEMINGRKEGLKKKIAGKTLPKVQIDQDTNRDFYIQNGFEYWPFRGEYWLDELGNYHYVGTQSCE